MNKILMSIIAVSAIFSNTSTIYANDIAVNNKIEERGYRKWISSKYW